MMAGPAHAYTVGVVDIDGGDSSTAERVVGRYLEGHRQADIARQLKISRERVGQILRTEEIPKRTRAEQNEMNYQLAISGREGEIETAFWDLRDFTKTARLVGVDERFVDRFLNDLWPDVRVFLDVGWGVSKTFSDDDLRDALRDASKSPSMPTPMTVEDYDGWAEADSSRPARITVMGRLGGWRTALLSAGLRANDPQRAPGDFTDEVCVEAVALCWREITRPPSMAAYSSWQQEHSSQPGVDRVRSRLLNWTNAKVAAYPLVHGKFPSQISATSDGVGSATEPSPSIGRAYRPRDVATWQGSGEVFPVDPSIVERGVRSHFDLEARVAQLASDRGLVPISPTASDPQFDVAWRSSGTLTLVEVKSATLDNLESQVRFGLGQVLGYAEQLRARGQDVRPALLIELPPAPIWKQVARRAGVLLVITTDIEALFSCRSWGCQA